MPNGKVHGSIGLLVGGGLACYVARFQEWDRRLLETIGGALGGYAGGRLPDLFEPARTPCHRGFAHSGAAAAAIIGSYPEFGSLADKCRCRANHHELGPSTVEDPLHKLGHHLVALFWRLLAGFLSGLVNGYLSHLALDAFTPKALPLLA